MSSSSSPASLPGPAAKPHHAGSTRKPLYKNPWLDQPAAPSSSGVFNYADLLDTVRVRAQSLPSLEWAREHPSSARVKSLKVVKPDFSLPDARHIKATWLGHAGYLVQLPGAHGSVVFDPMFSERAGPAQAGYTVGPGRHLPPPCTAQDLPDDVCFVCISHNHYDHLDLASILSIYAKRGKDVTFLVTLGNKAWFISSGIPAEQVIEFDWWEDYTRVVPFTCGPASELHSEPSTSSLVSSGYTTALSTPAASTPNLLSSPRSASLKASLRFTCVPAQHSSGRSLLDQRATLWGGWIVELFPPSPPSPPSSESEDITTAYAAPTALVQRSASVYHAGDTGYTSSAGPAPFFAEISEKFGPLDLALVPIWRGGSLGFVATLGLRLTHSPALATLHASPAEGRAIAQAVRARHTLAMHFGTFVGSALEAAEPLVELALLGQSQAKEKESEERLGPDVSVLDKEGVDAGEGVFGSPKDGSPIWGKRPGVFRRLTSLSNRSSKSNSRKGSDNEAEQDDDKVNEADRWKDVGGIGWLDIGGSALVPLHLGSTL